MKRVYTFSIFLIIFLMGCEKEVKFHESGRDLYYVDKNGEIFLLDDSTKSL